MQQVLTCASFWMGGSGSAAFQQSNSNDQLCQPYIMDSSYKGTWTTFFLLYLQDLVSPVPMLSGRWLAFLGSINCANHPLHCRWRVDSCSQNGILLKHRQGLTLSLMPALNVCLTVSMNSWVDTWLIAMLTRGLLTASAAGSGQSHHFIRNYTWRFYEEAWVVVLVSRPRIVLVGKPSVRVSLSPLFAMDPLEHGTPCHTSNGFTSWGIFLGGSFDIPAEVYRSEHHIF